MRQRPKKGDNMKFFTNHTEHGVAVVWQVVDEAIVGHSETRSIAARWFLELIMVIFTTVPQKRRAMMSDTHSAGALMRPHAHDG